MLCSLSTSFPQSSRVLNCGSLPGSHFVLLLSNFKVFPRVDTKERSEEKQVFPRLRDRTSQTKAEEMDMTKRVTLELRHRSPSEVSIQTQCIGFTV